MKELKSDVFKFSKEDRIKIYQNFTSKVEPQLNKSHVRLNLTTADLNSLELLKKTFNRNTEEGQELNLTSKQIDEIEVLLEHVFYNSIDFFKFFLQTIYLKKSDIEKQPRGVVFVAGSLDEFLSDV